MGVDFRSVADAALAAAAILLPQWLGGQRQGHEWIGERKANGGPGDSWSVNLDTGAFAHFAGEEKGGDLISLYAALNHLNQGAALEQVARLVGVTDRPVSVLPFKKPPEAPAEPIPLNAPEIPDHYKNGIASAVYRYGAAFVIARYDLPDGKQFCPFTWRAGRWQAKAYPEPRPLYGASELAKFPDAPVLIVEGEKCADVARATLRAYVVLTWAGGAQAVKKSDWSILSGRDVIVWPDADAAGAQAAATLAGILSQSAHRVRIIAPIGQPEGWDIADAVASGWEAKKITAWASEHIRPVFPAPQQALAPPADPESDYPAGTAPQSALVSWQDIGLQLDGRQIPHPTLANASAILQRHDYFRGKLWLDSFRGKVYHALDGVPKLWTDADSRRVTAWVQQHLQLPKINLALVQDAVLHAAECHQRNSLTDWLDSLRWDAEPRLDTWLADCLGAERNAYNDAVARNWPISMVARAYQPGCQVDTMPVLEGAMGRGKSRFLEVLAQPWFAAIQIAFGEKDFFQAIQGRWLIEIPDMSGFSRREHTQILATITTREDVYRKSHGRITEEHPRVTVFAATSETDDYLQDTRGRRRYWPLRCGNIDLDALRSQREQVFAEAVARYRAGAMWYDMPDSADEEQLSRTSADLWSEPILHAAEALWGSQQRTGLDMAVTSQRLLEEIGVEIYRQTDAEKKRVARIMKDGGWHRSRSNTQRRWLKSNRPGSKEF